MFEISEKSFYGNLEENLNSGNYYRRLQNIEYKITSQNDNINRYGPLLIINHNGKTINFKDTHYGEVTGKKFLILDYYKKDNEILLLEQNWDSAHMFIYNLDFEEYRCKYIDFPNYNSTRTYMLSLVYNDEVVYGSTYNLQIFKIQNNFYEELFNEIIFLAHVWLPFQRILWMNDHEVNIDYGEYGELIIKINDNVNVLKYIPSMLKE